MKAKNTYRGFSLMMVLFAMITSRVYAQGFGNEWIDHTQTYYKLSTAEDGMYRISYAELASIGFPVGAVDPQNIQIFHRGKEQAIFVAGQDDGKLDPTDYIDFYGRRNDGTLDRELYVKPEAQPHGFYNLYSDTTAYFLTWHAIDHGKRMLFFQESNTSNLTPQSHHLDERIALQTNRYTVGLHYPIGVISAETYLSAYDYGEGWTGTAIRQGRFGDIGLSNLENFVTTGPKPKLELLLTGENNLGHHVTIEVGPDAGSLRPWKSADFDYNYNEMVIGDLEWSDLTGGNLTVRVNVIDNGVSDRVSITMARLVYSQVWDQNSAPRKTYHLPLTNASKSFVHIDNVPSRANLYDISDEENILQIGYDKQGSGIEAIVPNDASGRTLLIASERKQVPKMRLVSMRKINPAKADFLIVTHKSLRSTVGNYQDVPMAYATYRASAPGGGYDTLLINVGQVYDLFSYGEYTPLALFRFCKFMAAGGDPKYLFIMGKGLTAAYLQQFRTGSSAPENRDLIPTSGFPGSDAIFTAGLKGTTYESGFPVGRVSAESPAALAAYFDKVKEIESTPNDVLWRKELVHLSGGRGEFQQNLFRSYVDGFKAVAESEYLGGKVETISKKTNGATELINIAEYVNAGKMLITFFGHSATTSADIEIGNVSNEGLGYHNKGKYPMMVVNGCNAGDMYNTGYGFGEDWIGTPDKGAVGFIAHTGAALTGRLKRYTDLFYEVAFTDTLFLGKGIGDIQKEVGKRYFSRYSNSESDISQIQQMSLQGDPAVVLFGAGRPDYAISNDNVFTQAINEGPINVFESFRLGLIVQNFGTTQNDSLKVAINRRLSNGQEYILDTAVYAPVFYKDTLYFEIPPVGIDGFGLNQFAISLDPLDEIDELDKTNNQTTFEYFVPLGGTSNVFPAKYAIVNAKEIQLAAQSLDLLMENRSYLFELDTTNSFNSPYKKQTAIPGNALAKWTVDLFDNLPDKDTVVFYWRTKFAEARPQELDLWSTSSFTFINNGPNGWAMAHFQQFHGNEMHQVVLNEANRSWEFERFETNIHLKTFGGSNPDLDYENVELTINNTQYIFPTRLCTNNSMNLVAFDKSTTIPYLALGDPFVLDRKNCGRTPQIINNMIKREIENQLLMEDYIETMGNGDYVLLFSIGHVTFKTWPASTIAKLAEIGINASDIQNLADGEPVIILGKKGNDPGTATIVKADYSNPTPPEEQEIMFDDTINGQAVSGSAHSPKIGPATNWRSFQQNTKSLESPSTDMFSFNIYGVDASQNETLLIGSAESKVVDLQSIDAAAYPYLRLELNLRDGQNLTPAQLQKWIVLYDGVPEGVLTYHAGQGTAEIEKKEGEIHEMKLAFDNVSNYDFLDSIAVEYSIFNHDDRKSYVDTLTVKPLKSHESVDFSLALETGEKVGLNDVKVFANPYLLTEQSYNNNYINFPKYLNVLADNTNPIMEVTVDGEFIMDGDIVSPSPIITLRLKDDGNSLPKEDTLGVHLYLNEQCDACQPVRISFSSPNITWTPATEDNDFTVEYQPPVLADGKYTLRAEAADASGNPSGSEPYFVNFEVINESQITNFFPYPNPFSTRTQFVFTLTGSEIPDEIIIQIMTVNGTVVREITQDEIGPVRIGHNKTEYAWDGRDEYGDQLANGVYLYKVKIYTNGVDMKHRETSADRAFKNGIGKMYLLR